MWNNICNRQALSLGLNEGVRLFSEDLAQAGYQLHYSGKWHVSVEESPADRGWTEHTVSGAAGTHHGVTWDPTDRNLAAGVYFVRYRAGDYHKSQRVVLVRNQQAFATRYETDGMPIAGEFSGRLSNAGERIVLTGALGRLNMVMEAYPDLKANENVAMLTEELTSTENKVAFARQGFNNAVMRYNTSREK